MSQLNSFTGRVDVTGNKNLTIKWHYCRLSGIGTIVCTQPVSLSGVAECYGTLEQGELTPGGILIDEIKGYVSVKHKNVRFTMDFVWKCRKIDTGEILWQCAAPNLAFEITVP